ncbi:MAG: DUF3467 domain-containing protein [Bacteroidales bacterium]|nr:DUF3467 domain-containing protein [Bacteroidales bacterium]
MEDNKNSNEMKIVVPPEVASGVYSNIAVITHSFAEVVIDFGQLLPDNPNTVVRSRVVMAPAHAKRLLMALQDNIQKYEHAHGPIEDPTMQGLRERPQNDDDPDSRNGNIPFSLPPRGKA